MKLLKLVAFLVGIVGLTSCSDAALEKELAEAKADLETAEQTLAKAEAVNDYTLTHVVYFKLKPDIDFESLTNEVKKLEAIDEVHDLDIGTFEDLGDKRALSDYQMVMEMSFKDKAAYKAYQTHPLHEALKKKVGEMLAGPPATYDYIRNHIKD